MDRQPIKRTWSVSEPESLFDNAAIRRRCFLPEDATSKNLDVLNHGIMKPGLRLPWFLHEDKDEMIIVLEGNAIMHFKGADAIELQRGDTLCVPAGIEHSLENTGDSDLEAIFFKVFC